MREDLGAVDTDVQGSLRVINGDGTTAILQQVSQNSECSLVSDLLVVFLFLPVAEQGLTLACWSPQDWSSALKEARASMPLAPIVRYT